MWRHKETGDVRFPAVAGAFYPGDSTTLHNQIQGFLKEALTCEGMIPKAIIAPHAGYVYSGPVAASAYKTLLPYADQIKKVVLLGPSHRVYLYGLAVSTARAYATPLGEVLLNSEITKDLTSEYDFVRYMDEAHAMEHSLEVQIPFLQETLENFTLIPLVVGEASSDQITEVIQKLWGGSETLIVISTDLSHFLDYSSAQKMDAKTANAIENFDDRALHDDSACGRYPVKGLLKAAHQKKMKIKRVDLRNSGDTAGGQDRVVGYGSWILYE